MRTAPSSKSDPVRGVATPIIKKTHWPYPLIWLIPVLAAVAAGLYYLDALRDRGPEITIKFTDGTGLKAGQTPVSHLGVQIGLVTSVNIDPDQKHVDVGVRLHRSQTAFATQGTLFWAVRPEISTQTISGLGTVLSGPYIDATPAAGGGGALQKEFIGLDKAPLAMGQGLKIILHASSVERLAADSIVYFRGIQVGVVQKVEISPDASRVDVHAFIWKRYAPLVRPTSRFWLVAGLDVKGGIFSGITMKIDSLRAILSGGVSFATPEEDMGPPVQDGAEFTLADDAKSDWLKWAPRIPLGPEDGSDQQQMRQDQPRSEPGVPGASGVPSVQGVTGESGGSGSPGMSQGK